MASSSNKRMAATVLLMVAILSVSVIAKSDICNVPVDGLMKCLPAAKQSPQPPTPECCSAIKTADFPCFCQYKDNPILKVFGVDIEQALKLPGKCGISGTPTHC